MGTTLQNGVYLPNEGERNCYAGLKTNWETLDQKIADITALQQAVAGALHREIVESLPTTDIDPNTIYMVLSGTSATENVYNEFMYVNNAWELIGTSATDLTNYYTKGEVDGLLLLKANASDLTSHTGDTTIHVTANDKSKWNTVALIKQLRLVNAQVGSATTIAFVNIDDTNGIKVGDKCMDLDAKMFEITAVDTTNQTVTVGSALIDIALDSDVVHMSGDETISGFKTFSSSLKLTAYPSIRMYLYDDEWNVLPQTTKQSEIRFSDKNLVTVSYFAFQHRSDSNEPFRTCWRQQKMDGTSGYHGIAFNNLGDFYPENNNTINLGGSGNRWKSVYATNYYYGSNNVEFSNKFVTTDTAQTVSGAKIFSSDLYVANTDTTANTPNLNLRNYKAERGTTDTAVQTIMFSDKNAKALSLIESRRTSNGNTSTNILSYNTDDSNNTVLGGVSIIKSKTYTNFAPNVDNAVTCGRALAKWSDVVTYKVNGLEPSALSMPDTDNGIDISSYITVNGGNKESFYTPTVNGWISVALTRTGGANMAVMLRQGNFASSGHNIAQENGTTTCNAMLPVKGGVQVSINSALADGIAFAYFYPCLGNV